MIFFSSCSTDKNRYTETRYELLSKGYGIHSSTLLVNDLKSTRDYYSDTLGFKMQKADQFKKGVYDGTITTRIRFPGMASIEFISTVDSLDTKNTPSFISNFLDKHEGIQNYSLSSSSVDTTYAWLIDQGFKMDSVQSYRTTTDPAKGWSRDDGGSQENSLEFANGNPTYLPRFVERTNDDYEKTQKMWKTYYAYNRSFTNHPNGVVGIASIQVLVDSLEVARQRFQKMGLYEQEYNSSKNTVRFNVKRNQELLITQPEPKNEEATQFMQERGSGVFAIRFEVKNLDSTYHYLSNKLPKEAIALDTVSERITVLRNYAKGVQLEFVNEPKEQALMAQQLKIGGKLDSVATKNAASMYQKYCALCHGENREGYAADNAPSLRSNSLLATSKNNNFMRYTIQFGRANTAMAGYLDTQGGPMEYIEIELLLQWLYEASGTEKPIKVSREPVVGDIKTGSKVYANKCAVCHGANGEGVTAPALGNPMLLATATDEFLKYAIKEGRDSTPMIGFKETLSEDEINGVTAFLRSRASGWNIPETDSITIPAPEDYVLNPNGKTPNFNLRDDLYVSAKQVYEAMQDNNRMIILDARSKVAWRQTHIPGSLPVPYYEDPENFINDLPNDDDTWIVVYCACPHAASQRVVNTLKRYNYKKLAIIDEGVLVWAQLGYPVKHGR